MTMVTVKFLHACCNWTAGAIEQLESVRAQKLIRTGYAELHELVENATVDAPEHAEQIRPVGRQPRTERRG